MSLARENVTPWLASEYVTPMRSDIRLNNKERFRYEVIERVLNGRFTNRQAAARLKLSIRHVIRLKKEVEKKGQAAMIHKNTGHKPANSVPADLKNLICQLALTDYRGASSKHISELLAEHQDIHISSRTIRRALKEAGIPGFLEHKKTRRFHRRKRRPRQGELVQADASPFAWLEDRGPEMSLHGIVDDATGKTLGLYFSPHEDLNGYMHVLMQMIKNHGVPQSFYADRHTIFLSPKDGKLSIDEQLDGKTVALTQFGRMLYDLGIEYIPAGTPQAKGRIERQWGTFQHRLVVEMRLAGINDIDEANAFLPGFIKRMNNLFEVAPEEAGSLFLKPPPGRELKRIISVRHERRASGASTLSWKGRIYQLLDKQGVVKKLKPRALLYVLEMLDGAVRAEYEGELYRMKVFEEKKETQAPPVEKKAPASREHKPPADHPWKRWVKRPEKVMV